VSSHMHSHIAFSFPRTSRCQKIKDTLAGNCAPALGFRKPVKLTRSTIFGDWETNPTIQIAVGQSMDHCRNNDSVHIEIAMLATVEVDPKIRLTKFR